MIEDGRSRISIIPSKPTETNTARERPIVTATARLVTDFLGDGVLMYSSDCPHAECRFPESTNQVLAWTSPENEAMRKLLWDNATRCFGEP